MKHILKQIFYILLAVALGMGLVSCTGHSNISEREEKEISEEKEIAEKEAKENQKKAAEIEEATKVEKALTLQIELGNKKFQEKSPQETCNISESEEKEIAEKEAEENQKKAAKSKQDTKKGEASKQEIELNIEKLQEKCDKLLYNLKLGEEQEKLKYLAPPRIGETEIWCLEGYNALFKGHHYFQTNDNLVATPAKVNTNTSTITVDILVKIMLECKLPIDDIMKLTDFSREEIEKISIEKD